MTDVSGVFNWVKDLLERGTGRPIGDTESPIARPEAGDFPYAILATVPGLATWGPELSQPDQNFDLVVQVSSAGLRPDQARWMADRVRSTMLARHPDGSFQVNPDAQPQGFVVVDRLPNGGPPENLVEATYTPTVYTLPERFTIRTVVGDPPNA